MYSIIKSDLHDEFPYNFSREVAVLSYKMSIFGPNEIPLEFSLYEVRTYSNFWLK